MAKVALESCTSYDFEKVDEAVSKCISYLGGISSYISKGEKVVLKVNLLRASKPEKAVITHPVILEAVIKQVQKAGGLPIIADSPGGAFTENALRRAYKICTYDEVAKRTGAELNYDTRFEEVEFSKGLGNGFNRNLGTKKLKIAKFVLNADKMITLPKLKTHMLMQFTGACKVEFGLVPGYEKMALHGKYPSAASLSKVILDIVERFPPTLSIMDAIVGMEGLGPGNGKPKRLGAVLASISPLALDYVAMLLVRINPESTPVFQEAKLRGLPDTDFSDIEILGKKLEDMVVDDFKSINGEGSDNSKLSAVMQALGRFAPRKPYVNSKCVGCGICKENCPNGQISIITIDNKKKAKIIHDNCIKCYCCHELCPHDAIDLRHF
ncbi:MAG: DUF362 domain-containing protein [Thermoplasmata archaeon]